MPSPGKIDSFLSSTTGNSLCGLINVLGGSLQCADSERLNRTAEKFRATTACPSSTLGAVLSLSSIKVLALPRRLAVGPRRRRCVRNGTWWFALTYLRSIYRYYSFMTIDPNTAPAPAKSRRVTILAPTLSAVVTGRVLFWKLSAPEPALGSPVDIPPESAVTGALPATLISCDETAARTLISCPAPVVPSYLPLAHLNPHCRL